MNDKKKSLVPKSKGSTILSNNISHILMKIDLPTPILGHNIIEDIHTVQSISLSYDNTLIAIGNGKNIHLLEVKTGRHVTFNKEA